MESKEISEKRIAKEGISQDEELNLDTFRAYVKNKIKDHEITKDDKGYSELLNELLNANYKTIREIDDKVKEAIRKLGAYE